MPASKYHIIKDFNDGPGLTTNPRWFIAIVSFVYPTTFSRAESKTASGIDPSLLARTNPTLIISDDCISLTIAQQKRSHLGTLSATLVNSGVNYLNNIYPGDWVFAWMLQDGSRADELIKRIKEGKAANRFMDGLKFVGRASSIRKIFNQSPSGVRSSSYSLEAQSFKELDASIFYDPHLAETHQTILDWSAKLNITIGSFLGGPASAGIDVNAAIPTLLQTLLGDGLPKRFAAPAEAATSTQIVDDDGPAPGPGLLPQIAHGLTSDETAPWAYVVPEPVGKILGITGRSKKHGLFAYADVLDFIHGLQKYKVSAQESNPWEMFTPIGIENQRNKRHKRTNTDMLGIFQPQAPDFSGKSVWGILTAFQNPTMNEMFTTLRASPEDGRVVPTMILRQRPFSTPTIKLVQKEEAADLLDEQADAAAIQKIKEERALNTYSKGFPTKFKFQLPTNETEILETTQFHELPRWVADKKLITNYSIGRSDKSRFNFLRIVGQFVPSLAGIGDVTAQLVRSPPMVDSHDIKVHGLRPKFQTFSISPLNLIGGVTQWMRLITDWTFGQHLTLTGTASLLGVQAPIASGDNFQYEDMLFHIEGLVHKASISNLGIKNFVTSLYLTNGMNEAEVNLTLPGGLRLPPWFLKFAKETSVNDPGLGKSK